MTTQQQPRHSPGDAEGRSAISTSRPLRRSLAASRHADAVGLFRSLGLFQLGFGFGWTRAAGAVCRGCRAVDPVVATCQARKLEQACGASIYICVASCFVLDAAARCNTPVAPAASNTSKPDTQTAETAPCIHTSHGRLPWHHHRRCQRTTPPCLHFVAGLATTPATPFVTAHQCPTCSFCASCATCPKVQKRAWHAT